MSQFTRRAFLAVAAVFAPLSQFRTVAQPHRPAAPQQPPVSLDAFLRVSRRLTGRTRLDPAVARTYLSALLAERATGPLLARLTQATGPQLTAEPVALERTIVECWYTGLYTIAALALRAAGAIQRALTD